MDTNTADSRKTGTKARVGLLSLSDGRDFVHRDLKQFVEGVEADISARLVEAGYEVIRATEPVWTNEIAVREGRRLAAAQPDLTIFNLPIWAFPHFAMLAAEAVAGPLLLFSNLDPTYPGMVGMLAAGGGLDQIGRVHARAWGSVSDPSVMDALEKQIRAGRAVTSLRGSTFGRIGGRPMGMYTAVSNTDQWLTTFGVDVEEIDQFELVRRAQLIEGGAVANARMWLERHSAGVHYDGNQLTPAKLELQLRSYYAMRELINDWHLDFSGIKGQPELTTHYASMDITEAFLNDPYDWDGNKAVHVCATEADMDGALTMQILHKLSGTPVLFADMRHYHPEPDVWDLCNSGQHATWFASRSADPLENLRHTHFYPQVFYFPAGGAAVHHLAAPGLFTFARLSRLNGRYRMQVVRGSLQRFDDTTNESLMRQSTYVWPHAFAKFEAGLDEVLSRYGSNHIHAVPGDFTDELRSVCRFFGIEFDGFGALRPA